MIVLYKLYKFCRKIYKYILINKSTLQLNDLSIIINAKIPLSPPPPLSQVIKLIEKSHLEITSNVYVCIWTYIHIC